ncbi:hypothetical protein FO519_008268 [Halicephalobus sp. NKZ332]|nr:hypothetical protein FO519_008268 [Halicephalobus sp. NKZ332]
MCFLSVPRQHFDRAAQNLQNEANFGDDTKLLSNIPSSVYACQCRPNLLPSDWTKILYGELERNKLIEEYPLPEGIFFLDSYLAFLDLEKSHLDNLATITTSVDWEKISEVIQLAKFTTNQNEEVIEPGPSVIRNNNEIQVLEDSLPTHIQRSAVSGFVTPPRKKSADRNEGNSAKKGCRLFNDNEVLPLAFMDTGKWSPAKKRRTEKSFFRRVSESKWEFNDLKAKEYFFKGNFKLESLFKQVTKSQYNAHHAHADCEALLQVCLAYGDEFGSYMDRKKEEIPIFQNKNGS